MLYPSRDLTRFQKISGKNCIIVEFTGHEGLYSAYGRFYLRSGEEDKKLSVIEVRRLVEKMNDYAYQWGSEVSDTSIIEADIPTIRAFVKKGKDAGRISFSFDSAKNVLNKLHLIKGNKLFNAGKVLFFNDNRVEVQAAVFAGREKITFLDIQNFHGNLFDLIEKSESYIKEHINWRADLSGSKRIEIPEVPVRAIKEAIINSLCHRDFTNPKSNEITIYRDRIEIYNPGQFRHDYSPEDFIKGTEASIPRNPLIAEALYRSEDIEKWGSGLRRISEECKVAGIKVSFTKIKSRFSVIFYRPNLDMIQAGSQKVLRTWSEKSSEKILAYIRANKDASANEIGNKLGLSQRAIEKQVANLKEKGLLRRIGPDKGGCWEVVEK